MRASDEGCGHNWQCGARYGTSGAERNRLINVNNGYTGQVYIGYENISPQPGQSMANMHRVTSRTVTDGRGNAATWSYSYGTPTGNTTSNSAALYYNLNRYAANNTKWLIHGDRKEFRGHDYVQETAPDGTLNKHWFYQGGFYSGEAGACTVTATGGAMTNDACFLKLRDHEFWKGQERQTQVWTSGGTLLSETAHQFVTEFYDYGAEPLAGQWRAFHYTGRTDERAYEGSATPSVKTTITCYQPNKQGGAQYGNPTHVLTYDHAAAVAVPPASCEPGASLDNPVRLERTEYRTAQSYGTYIVDRPVQQVTYAGTSTLLAMTELFYDGQHSSYGGLGWIGDLTLTRAYRDVALNPMTSRDTSYGYDGYGNQTTVTTYTGYGARNWNGSVLSYSAPGNGSASRITTTAYDSTFHAYPSQQTNALGHVEQAQYNTLGQLTRVIDANNNPTDATYDLFGRVLTVVKPGDSVATPTTQIWYYDTEVPTRIVVGRHENPSWRPLTTFYDGLGRPIQSKNESQDAAQNIVQDWRYDGFGRVTGVSQPRYVNQAIPAFWNYVPPGGSLFQPTTTTYDGLGRPLRITTPNNAWTEHRYSLYNGLRLDDVVDPNRHRTQYRSDSLGRLVHVEEISGDCGLWGYSCSTAPYTTSWLPYASTQYAYDARDLLTGVTDAVGNHTSVGYDALGRKTGLSDPDMGSWVYGYDPQGSLTSQRDSRLVWTTSTYDALDRLTLQSFSDGSPTLRHGYDYNWSANGIGRLSETCADVGGGCPIWQHWGYTARGQVASTEKQVLGVWRMFRWAYDSAERVTEVVYPSGRRLQYTYDAAWRPTSAWSLNEGPLVNSVSYTALDQPQTTATADGLVETRIYDGALSRLVQYQIGLPSNLGSLFNRSYAYDNGGNITAISDARNGSNNQWFGYDHRDRLTSWNLNGAVQSTSYDRLGNLLSKGATSYSYPCAGCQRPHAPSSVGGSVYSYDTNGNLLSGGGRTYSWNGQNLPTSITSGGVSESYRYDADGARVARTRSGVTTLYFLELLEETLGGGSVELFHLRGQLVATRTSAGAWLSYHHDHLGSVALATTNAALVSQQEFDPWGQVRAGGLPQTTVNYTGQRLDSTGLLYYHARYYDPVLGRFVSPDTIVPGGSALTIAPSDATAAQLWAQGGKAAGPANPQELNRYSYVGNNPVNHTDPTGHAAGLPDDPLKGMKGGRGSAGTGGTGGGSTGTGATGTNPAAAAAAAQAQAAGNSSTSAVRTPPGQVNGGKYNVEVGPAYTTGRGVDSNAHNANVRVTENGQTVRVWREISGEQTAQQQALGYPKGMSSSHTEYRALTRVNLNSNQTMTITGQNAPCSSCKGVMNQAARDTGATVRYQWRENGVTRRWYAGSR